MIKSVRPGKLRGLTLAQLEMKLSTFFGCEVVVEEDAWFIYAVDQYDDPKLLAKHANRLANLGRVSFVGDRHGVAVKLLLNPLTLERLQCVTTTEQE